MIRKSTAADLPAILTIAETAFGEKQGKEVADLVDNLLKDPSATPLLSLIAIENQQAIGHILFTQAKLSSSATSASILAPLGVQPNYQNQGIGKALIEEGLIRLSQSGTELVFVLGHPRYYPKFGFQPAIELGLIAPYPPPEELKDAWMVHALKPNLLGKIQGEVICCDELSKPEHWRE